MLTDHWIIAQLLAQLCIWGLLLKAGLSAVKMLRFWEGESRSSRQLELERETYLVGSIAQLALGFQFVALVLFLATANLHLPGMLKGAMCATGVLELNDLGYPLLALKSLSVMVYGVFLSLNYLDGREPGYVLTPKKYWWIFPSLALLSADLGLSIAYFAELSPDIIATCCSVSFGNQGSAGFFHAELSGIPWDILGAFWALGAALLLAWWRKANAWILLPLSLGFVGMGILSLKLFFVKYIYGLPSHACLFDIFWGKYYYVGYIIFGSYYALGFSVIFRLVIQAVKQKLSAETFGLERQLRWIGVASVLVATVLPLMYWLLWEGNL